MSAVQILAAFSNHFPISRMCQYCDENRVFNKQWAMQFLFTESK